MTDWYIYKNEQQAGPYSTEEIKKMIEKTELTANDYIYGGAYSDWLLISAVSEFSDILPATYYIYKNDEQLGPFDLQHLKNMFDNNQITIQDYYYDPKINNWLVFSGSELLAKLQNLETRQNLDGVQDSVQHQEKSEQPKKLEFPCKNHPNVESYLICPLCQNDYCSECLIEYDDKHYCKTCFEANKERITLLKNAKKSGIFSKLFKKS
ncbi:MAG TPA: GYF domain-containing protein [bacterium]|nr:GYF domain-containing protein [bacterium]HPP88478.1 GYF domain-containing protein [bacterium]